MDIYIYLALVMLIMFIWYESISTTLKYCPIKIKEVLVITFILVLFRIATLWGLLLLDHMKLVYLVRNLVFLNIIYIPMIMFVCIYIFYRNTKLNIKWVYYIFAGGIITYLICIFAMPMEYYISPSYGYNIVLGNMMPYKILLGFSGIIFFMGMNAFKHRYSVKWGIALIEVASLVFIITTVLVLRSTENIGFLLIGELGWLIVLYSGIRTFMKK